MNIWKKNNNYIIKWSLDEIDSIKEKKLAEKAEKKAYPRRIKWESTPIEFCVDNPVSVSKIVEAYNDYKMSECY